MTLDKEDESKVNADEARPSIVESFPWVSEFRNMCGRIHMDKTETSLMELMRYYLRYISISVNECYGKPVKTTKLKESMAETLVLFLYMYRDLSDECNKHIYLDNMSDLLAMYIDTELKASKKSKEDCGKICARLTSCLYLYLEHSIEHLLDTLLKIQFMCRSYRRILNPIITKVIKNLPVKPESCVMYIRYLLIYRLWRKINEDAKTKNEITATAVATLGPPPTGFPPDALQDSLPKVPKSQANSAKYLLQQKFDVRKSCESFVRFCKKSRENVSERNDETNKVSAIVAADTSSGSTGRTESQMLEDSTRTGVAHVDTNVGFTDKTKENSSASPLNTLNSLNSEDQNNFNNRPLGTISSNVSVARVVVPKSLDSKKLLSRRKSKKSNKIVIIDLTTDVALEKCIKKRKCRKLAWLEEAKKKIGIKIAKSSRKTKRKSQEKPNDLSTNDGCQLEDLLHREDVHLNTDLVPHSEVKERKEARHIELEDNEQNESRECSITRTNETTTTSADSNITDIDEYNGDKAKGAGESVIERTTERESVLKEKNSEKVAPVEKVCETNSCEDVGGTEKNDNLREHADELHTSENRKETFSLEKDTEREESIEVKTAKNVVKREAESSCTLESKNRRNLLLVREILKHTSEATVSITTVKDKDEVQKQIAHFKPDIANQKDLSENVTRQQAEKEIPEISRNDRSSECVRNLRKETLTNDGSEENAVVHREHKSVILRTGKEYQYVREEGKDKSHNPTHPELSGKEVINEKLVKGKYVVRESDLEENIDGLSLLASVSQHVPHLNPGIPLQLNLKRDHHIKVKDYESLRKTVHYDRTAEGDEEEETTTPENSSNIVSSEVFEDSPTDYIGVYPENALHKVAFHVEVTSTSDVDVDGGSNVEEESRESFSHRALESNTVKSIVSEMENGIQQTKENTNVILNGETVVLLQKSPNSNLYIINKAVEGAKKNAGEEETGKVKAEENWVFSTSEDYFGSFESGPGAPPPPPTAAGAPIPVSATASVTNRILFDLEENGFGKKKVGIGIKVEPEEEILAGMTETKSHVKRTSPNISKSTDLLTSVAPTSVTVANQRAFRDADFFETSVKKPSVGKDKRKSSGPASSSSSSNVKREYEEEPSARGIVESTARSTLHMPPPASTLSSAIYAQPSCGGAGADLCVPYRKTRCSCLNCAYDMVTRCRQCIHPAADSRVTPCMEGNSYFLPARTTSLVQTASVQERDGTRSEPVTVSVAVAVPITVPTVVPPPPLQSLQPPTSVPPISSGKILYEKQSRKLESALLESTAHERKISVKYEAERSRREYEKTVDNKLPLKKRLKAHAMMYPFEDVPVKTEKPDSYPGIPMMSIAALETLGTTEKCPATRIVEPIFELSPEKKDEDPYHCSSNLVRRDYYKESARRQDRHFRVVLDDRSEDHRAIENVSRQQKLLKSAQRKADLGGSSSTTLKRIAIEQIEQEHPSKKPKKPDDRSSSSSSSSSSSCARQTRSSKRNVPKVNYRYADVDPEWNPSGETRRKRKKTGR